MGAEQGYEDMQGTFRDSEVFEFVGKVLQSVRMDPFLIDIRDKDYYDYMLGIIDPTKKRSTDDEAMFVTILRALSQAVSKIDTVYHHALLHNIFTMCVWHLHSDTRVVFLDLITRLAAVADQYLRECLQMLVNNFTPPGPLIRYIEEPRWLPKKEKIYSQLQESLKMISDTVPLAPRMLKDIIDRSMPKLFDSKAKMVSFVKCMLGLDAVVWDIIGSSLLEKVNITWEDILQDEHNKGIFDMELEDLAEDEDNLGQEGTKVHFGGNMCAEKLDGLMVVVCEHLKSRVEEPERLIKEFVTLKAIFKSHVLRVHKSKFAQFIMFYACSLHPEIGDGFANFLTDIFIDKDKNEDAITRVSAVSYVGSYLSRARFISVNIVVSVLKRLVDWCDYYCGHQLDNGVTANPIKHQLFYASCQAVMYVLCFRLRSIMDYPNLKQQLFRMRIRDILVHPLQPLKVCLPSIVNEFLRQATAASLFHAPAISMHEDAVESDLSKAFGGLNRLDMFFPFDPYLLKESDRNDIS
uniref:RNA polymerase I specific transcription initiation factor RRN3 protein n=1 Tax=Zea mays TaxID=4577 RepID=A0A804PCJ5_MAIZE